MKRIFALFLILALALSLCACGKEKNAAAPEAAPLAGETKMGWSMHYLPLPEEIVSSGSKCADGNYIYLTGIGPDGNCTVGRYDGERFTPYQVPAGLEKLSGCFPTWGGGLGVLCEPDDHGCPGELLLYDGEGQLLSRQDLTAAMEEVKRLGKTEVDGGAAAFILRAAAWFDGCLYLAGDSVIFQLDSGLQLCRSFSGFSMMLSFISSPLGLLALVYSHDGQDGSLQVRRLASSGGEPEPLLSFPTDLFDGTLAAIGYTPEGELLLDVYGDRLCKAAPPDGVGETLFDYAAAGLSCPCTAVFPWSGGYLYANYGDELACLQYGPLPEKTALTLWTAGVDTGPLDSYLQRYNLSDSPWLVRTESISDEQEAAAELAAGRGPDLYAFAENSFLGWSGSTVFEELSPYMAASGRSRADFLPSLMEAVNPGEELYSVPLGFILANFYQNTALLPDPGASLADAFALPQVQSGEIRVLPESSYTGWLDLFPNGFTRDSLFDWLATVYMGTHLDETNGSCDFDNPDYVNLLESCAAVRRSLAPEDAPSVYRYLNNEDVWGAGVYRSFFGDDYSLKNALGSLFSLSTVLAISSGSQNKEGAWDFIDYCLSSPLGASQRSISTLNATLDQQLALLASGKVAYAEDATPEDAAKFRELLENTHAVVGEHPELLAILQEEAQRFFAGQVTAQEAAAASQSRAEIYMAERFG